MLVSSFPPWRVSGGNFIVAKMKDGETGEDQVVVQLSQGVVGQVQDDKEGETGEGGKGGETVCERLKEVRGEGGRVREGQSSCSRS